MPQHTPRPTCPIPEAVKKVQEDQDQPKHLAFARSSWSCPFAPFPGWVQSLDGLVLSCLIGLVFNGGDITENKEFEITKYPHRKQQKRIRDGSSLCREPISNKRTLPRFTASKKHYDATPLVTNHTHVDTVGHVTAGTPTGNTPRPARTSQHSHRAVGSLSCNRRPRWMVATNSRGLWKLSPQLPHVNIQPPKRNDSNHYTILHRVIQWSARHSASLIC